MVVVADRAASGQMSFADIAVPDNGREPDGSAAEPFTERSLFETTMVVVDLETTGSSPSDDRITEIGAVKIRGGEVLGEFATLVDPGRTLPPKVVALTGITEMMVCDAPRIDDVLPAFVEFARGAVLVAHNARFDMGFLRHNALRLHLDWPFATSLCTVTLARRVLSRDEAPTVRLSALADLFDVSVRPTHRALDDARATVDVLHHLLERVGNQGVRTYRDLTSYLPSGNRRLRAQRGMAEHLPPRPGVYLFRGPSGEVLYVGTATDLRRRVMSYFTGSDPRRRMSEMVTLAARVDHVECAHALEAGVRELRLLGAHAPPYNRRSRQPHRGWWISLSAERFPRLRVSRTPSDDAIGPIGNRRTASLVADTISRAAGLRTCSTRLGASASHHWCAAPAQGGPVVGGCAAAAARPQTLADYLPRVAATHALLTGASDTLLHDLRERLDDYSRTHMFETAARHRDGLAETIDVLARCQRLASLCAIAELIVARPDGDRGWDLAVIRHGRLASAGVARRGVAPMPVVDVLIDAAETVVPGSGPLQGAPSEEAALLYRWITEPGARIVAADTSLALPAGSAQRWTAWSAGARGTRSAAVGYPEQSPRGIVATALSTPGRLSCQP